MKASSQLKQVFKLIDTNGDGKISSFELSGYCLGHKKCAAKKEAEKIIRQLDSTGDRYIDLDDLLNVITDCGSEKDDLMDAFLIFDIDKNGFISAKELNKVLTGLGYKKCDLEECFLIIKGVDKDGNGLVDLRQFQQHDQI